MARMPSLQQVREILSDPINDKGNKRMIHHDLTLALKMISSSEENIAVSFI